MSNEKKLDVVDDVHPGRMRSLSNGGDGMKISPDVAKEQEKLMQEVATAIKYEEKGVDYYPSAIREIENQGNTMERKALHHLEDSPALSGHVTVAGTDLYPAVAANNLGSDFRSVNASAPVNVDKTLYPAVAAQNTGFEQVNK